MSPKSFKAQTLGLTSAYGTLLDANTTIKKQLDAAKQTSHDNGKKLHHIQHAMKGLQCAPITPRKGTRLAAAGPSPTAPPTTSPTPRQQEQQEQDGGSTAAAAAGAGGAVVCAAGIAALWPTRATSFHFAKSYGGVGRGRVAGAMLDAFKSFRRAPGVGAVVVKTAMVAALGRETERRLPGAMAKYEQFSQFDSPGGRRRRSANFNLAAWSAGAAAGGGCLPSAAAGGEKVGERGSGAGRDVAPPQRGARVKRRPSPGRSPPSAPTQDLVPPSRKGGE
eukprot:gene22501-67276_t